MSQRPPFGICLPVEFRRCRDGDTVEVGIAGGAFVWAVRLLDCWAPEMSGEEGRLAKHYAEKMMEQCVRPVLWLPITGGTHNLLASFLSFDRLLGHIFLSENMTLSEAMVQAGHASKEKPTKTKEAANDRV
jgi:endonuclease YncB( thermonuclease family)